MKRVIIALCASALVYLGAFAAEPARLKAGAATSNITPELGSLIVGGFTPIPSRNVHDELHARCLVLDDGAMKLALVVCDLIGIHRSVSVEARRFIQAELGIPAENVLISATHTHQAASARGGYRVGSQPELSPGTRSDDRYSPEMPLDSYQKFVARRIADGVRRAAAQLRPAQIAFGKAEAPEYAFNRRWLMREGAMPVNPFGKFDKVKQSPPFQDPGLVRQTGEIDSTISFIALREPAGRLISIFSAFSMHYVGRGISDEISADYYGMYCEALRRLQPPGDLDRPFVAIMASGTSADMTVTDRSKPAPTGKPYVFMRAVADDMAAKVHAALGGLTWKDQAPLAASYREAEVDWRPIDAETLAWAKKIDAIPATSSLATTIHRTYARHVQRLARAKEPAVVPLQVLRIGDIGIGTIACEIFAEIGLEFKRRSPIAHSFMVSLNHGTLGYLPTPRHFELGGYETWPGTNNLEPQASVKLMDALLEMAGGVARW